MGTTLAYFTMATALYIVAQRLYYITYEWARLVKLVLVTAVVFMLGYWIWTVPWQKAGLLIAFPLTLFLMRFFEKGELKRASALFRRSNSRQQLHAEKQAAPFEDNL